MRKSSFSFRVSVGYPVCVKSTCILTRKKFKHLPYWLPLGITNSAITSLLLSIFTWIFCTVRNILKWGQRRTSLVRYEDIWPISSREFLTLGDIRSPTSSGGADGVSGLLKGWRGVKPIEHDKSPRGNRLPVSWGFKLWDERPKTRKRVGSNWA